MGVPRIGNIYLIRLVNLACPKLPDFRREQKFHLVFKLGKYVRLADLKAIYNRLAVFETALVN